MLTQNIFHTRGDTFKRNIKLQTSEGALNITGATIYFTMKKSYKDTTAYFQKAFTITNALLGEAQLTVGTDETKLFEPNLYVYDISFRDSNNEVQTIVSGNIEIKYDVTSN